MGLGSVPRQAIGLREQRSYDHRVGPLWACSVLPAPWWETGWNGRGAGEGSPVVNRIHGADSKLTYPLLLALGSEAISLEPREGPLESRVDSPDQLKAQTLDTRLGSEFTPEPRV